VRIAFERFSPQSVYQRFLHPVRELTFDDVSSWRARAARHCPSQAIDHRLTILTSTFSSDDLEVIRSRTFD
jgi:hypothetical protein